MSFWRGLKEGWWSRRERRGGEGRPPNFVDKAVRVTICQTCFHPNEWHVLGVCFSMTCYTQAKCTCGPRRMARKKLSKVKALVRAAKRRRGN